MVHPLLSRQDSQTYKSSTWHETYSPLLDSNLANFSPMTLSDILDGKTNVLEKQEESPDPVSEDSLDPAFCVECKDMPTEQFCITCDESFCQVCFEMIHKNGKRKSHKRESVASAKEQEQETPSASERDEDSEMSDEAGPKSIEPQLLSILQRNINFIPVRLSHDERRLLHLLEAALSVSEYTDKVDILSYSSKAKRIVQQLKEICSILAGLVVASDLKKGQKLVQDREFSDNAEWYQTVFEIGRRYKVMNPEKMRDSFGKLCYMVMDSRLDEIREHMEFDLYKPIVTVSSFLTERDPESLKMFQEPLILDAVSEIAPSGPRPLIQRQIKQKERAVEAITSKYSSRKLDKETIRQVLYSIGDFHAYTNANRKPVVRMLKRLQPFQELESDPKYSLGIRFGRGGARLSHTHGKQYSYVMQSLELWSLIMRENIRLWSLADDDLMSSHRYQLTSTGQGLNRVKQCPSLLRAMHKILSECQRNCQGWVGSSVVHLGDHTVPNALFFLDKYFQVPRILIPVDRCLAEIENLVKDPFVKEHIDNQFGSHEELQKAILADFFRHAFDGSGADNFYDAGSCIDGRLTSAWNWANLISKKPYYKFFLMSGFVGFNGLDGF